jgi:hypothetical protein
LLNDDGACHRPSHRLPQREPLLLLAGVPVDGQDVQDGRAGDPADGRDHACVPIRADGHDDAAPQLLLQYRRRRPRHALHRLPPAMTEDASPDH